MPLAPGAKLGPYEILTGSVEAGFKAADTRLNRTVTIKVLPPGFSEHPAMKDLSHPHICAVYDVGHEDAPSGSGQAVDYVVMEYLEGETLAERLRRGPLDLQEALQVAIAMAGALDQAHRRGVTHRCLSASSVVLTPSGPKLVDLGWSKPTAAIGPAVPVSTLLTRSVVSPLTAMPLATASSMAPEQWEGLDVDARADIFAFGTILYAMLTGKPAFEGKTQALLLAAIATIEPEPVSTAQPLLPPALDYVVNRCLAKDPRQRWQTAWDLMGQLQWIADAGTHLGDSAHVSSRQHTRNVLVWSALAVLTLAAALLTPYAIGYLRTEPEAEEVRFSAFLGAGVATPLTVSPDGRWITQSLGSLGLNAVTLGSTSLHTLVPDNVVYQPFWSPDSRSIAFFEEGKLKKAEVSGGPAQIICDAPGPIGGGTWSRDGVIVFASGGVLHRVLAAGGQSTPITSLDPSSQETEHLGPSFLPDGRRFLYLSLSPTAEGALYLGSLDSKDTTRLFAAESKAIYVAPGHLLFNRGGTVFAQAFDLDTVALTGEAIRIADGVAVNQIGVNVTAGISRNALFSASQTGVLAYRPGLLTGPAPSGRGSVGERSLVWFDRTGQQTGLVGGPGTYAGVDLSPDGQRVAVHVHDNIGGDSWFFDAAQGRMQRLTFDASQDNSMPLWSPDGTRIAFGSKRGGNKWGLYVKRADGTSQEELIVESELPKMPMSWSPDGARLVYWVDDPKTRGDVWAVPLTGDRKPVPVLQSPANELNPQISADGKWIAYSSNETGRPEIYVKPFPDGPGKWQISTAGGQWPRWRRDGKELFFSPMAPNIMAVDIRVTGASVQPGVPHVLFGINNPNPAHLSYHRFAVSADGQRFLVPQVGSGPIAAGGFADQIAAAADQGGTLTSANNAVTVVLNWPQMLKRK